MHKVFVAAAMVHNFVCLVSVAFVIVVMRVCLFVCAASLRDGVDAVQSTGSVVCMLYVVDVLFAFSLSRSLRVVDV